MTDHQPEATDDNQPDAPRGLGHVVYSDPTPPPATAPADPEIEDASEDSFPASDPPGYAVGNPKSVTDPA